jgi:hypothetical protein
VKVPTNAVLDSDGIWWIYEHNRREKNKFGREVRPNGKRYRAVQKSCELCGEEFLTHRKVARFCSMKCRPSYRGPARPSVDKECPECGKAFTVIASNSTARWCSRACYKTAWVREIRAATPEKVINRQGYIIVRAIDDPLADAMKKGSSDRVLEHRLVMARHLGRPLSSSESVHHKNGNREDNRIDNLELWVSNQPAGQRVDDVLAWAREIIDLYDPTPTQFGADSHA